MPEAEKAMRVERSSLEDQVGGLVDHPSRRTRRRRSQPAPAAAEEQRYELYARDTLTVRAARADEADARRHVA